MLILLRAKHATLPLQSVTEESSPGERREQSRVAQACQHQILRFRRAEKRDAALRTRRDGCKQGEVCFRPPSRLPILDECQDTRDYVAKLPADVAEKEIVTDGGI